MRWLLVVVLMVSLGLNAGLAWRLSRFEDRAGPPDRPWNEKAGHALRDTSKWRGFLERRLEHLRRELDLDENQVDAFRTLHSEAHGLGRRFRNVQSSRLEVFERVVDGQIDPDGVRAAVTELSRRQAAVDSLIVEKVLQELEILRPEQRSEYLRMLPRERFGGRGPGEHGRGGGRNGQGRRTGPPDGG
ncbi:MAG: periplasmic heavy metal sensor [bacterium]|nr:periplasmic heavy metal sensor [bacterium]